MATKRTPTPPPAATPPRPPYMLIEQIQVKGYKSLVDATLHVRPLTLLAGTNSSGKSSIMQPLLLIKQTMEAPYQPAGALVLDGAHVQAETAGELVSKVEKSNSFSFQVKGNNVFSNEILPGNSIKLVYQTNQSSFVLLSQEASSFAETFFLNPNTTSQEIDTQISEFTRNEIVGKNEWEGRIHQDSGLIDIIFYDYNNERQSSLLFSFTLKTSFGSLMHIPGLRGAPKRSYPATFFQNQIKGTFDLYAAGTINQWQQQNANEFLAQLNNSLQRLGLTNTVVAKVKNANEIELRVNRLPVNTNRASKKFEKKSEMVNIADVGIGVSQVLPILVALIAAQEGQIVYVEQPELHLHPRAQVEMAHLLAAAAKRGVRVIVETHSSLLLLTVQTLVAEGELTPDQVGLHWFARNAKGATTVTLAEVDENGAYGDWPEDFGDVELAAQSAYLNANTKRQPFKPTTYTHEG